jgi:MFS transporter, SP family, solute carrier family 2 (myo-inositol transporter), member 13
MHHPNAERKAASGVSKAGYNRFVLLVAGLGGLLYGVDVGIIAGALPYLVATSGLTASQLSFIVAAVLLGSVISTLFAGALADRMGRKRLMIISGALFVASIPIIALARGYEPLILGRLLQGISAGLIGVVVPLYLAECLGAANRGKGIGIFQWLLTLGIVSAAAIGMFFSLRVEAMAKLGNADKLLAFKDTAWRSIFWVSLPPGLLFICGSLVVAESPRWLFRRGQKDAARAALLRSRTTEQAEVEMREMEEIIIAEKAGTSANGKTGRESLMRRKYVVPFILACVIPICNQATGVNTIIGYNATILLQSGLSDIEAHWGYVILTLVNFLLTIGGVLLVDRWGRKFLISLGSAGIVVSLGTVGVLFHQMEKLHVDANAAVQAMVTADQRLTVAFDQASADRLLATVGGSRAVPVGKPVTLIVIYAYGDFRAATKVLASNDPVTKPIQIARGDCVPSNKVVAFFSNPLASLDKARSAPLRIENALITPLPDAGHGWMTAIAIFSFMAFFAVGPGVCGWVAISELMPTRIRSNGMSIALVLGQAVSTAIAATFLQTVGRYGYSAMFFAFAGITAIYFIIAAFILPETKGKTLEEIEEYFEKDTARG